MSLLMDALSKAEKERHKVENRLDKKHEDEILIEPDELLFESRQPVEEKKPIDEKPLDLSFLSLSGDDRKDKPEPSETKVEVDAESSALKLATELPTDLPLNDLIEQKPELSPEPSVVFEPPAPKIESKKNYDIPVLGIAKKASNLTPWLIGGGVLLIVLAAGVYYFKSTEVNNSSITRNTVFDHDSLQSQRNYEAEEVELTKERVVEVLEKPKTNLVAEIKSDNKAVVKKQQTVERVIPKLKTGEISASIVPSRKEDTIHVQREEPKIDYLQQALEQAYEAYQAGYMVHAEQQYQIALQYEPDNQDALLGMAVISQSLNNEQQAKTYYQKLLKLNPKNSIAMSGLISMQQDLVQSANESRLKLLLSEEPDAAYLYAALGAQYVAESRWSEAQQAFLKAHHYDSNNPDYTYNLAITLDHLGQIQAAIKYYKQALFLSKQFSAGFKNSVIESRLLSLLDSVKVQ